MVCTLQFSHVNQAFQQGLKGACRRRISGCGFLGTGEWNSLSRWCWLTESCFPQAKQRHLLYLWCM